MGIFFLSDRYLQISEQGRFCMYYYLNGFLALLEPDRAVVDCGGVGYLVSITRKTYDSLAAGGAFNASGNTVGNNVKLLTYYVVREDAAELYGFFSERERDLFKMLIGISGVGPKAALAVLSVLSPDDFITAVAAQDARAISAAQGVGLKSAQKIILELKDKLTDWGLPTEEMTATSDAPSAGNDMFKEAVNALVVLGYSRQESMGAIRKASGATLEELIRSALTKLM